MTVAEVDAVAQAFHDGVANRDVPDVEPLEVREAGELTIEYGRYTLGLEPQGAEPATRSGSTS